MLDMLFEKNLVDVLPVAIQFELKLFMFQHVPVIWLSPFICAYYLQFLCYHEMQQHENRDGTLQQMTEVPHYPQEYGAMFSSLNIAGHCLFLAGRTAEARDMFNFSYLFSQLKPPYDKYNSALWYLLHLF